MNPLALLLVLISFSPQSFAATLGRDNFLSYGPGAAEGAMGGAVVGIVSGPEALYYNSSRLGMGGGGASAEWTRLMPGVSYSWLGASLQLRFVSIGLGMTSLDLGDATTHASLGDPGSTVSSYERAYMLGMAREVAEGLYLGTTFGLLDMNLAGAGARAIYGDAGASYRLSERATLGATLKNFYFSGLSFGGDRETYPEELRLGGSYEWRGLSFVGQADKALDGSAVNIFGGVSATLYRVLVLRGGYNGYPAFGFGIKSLGNRFGFDFSFQEKDVSSTERMTLSYSFKSVTEQDGPADPFTEMQDHAKSLADYYREESRRLLEAHSGDARVALRKLLALEPWNGDAAQALSAEAGKRYSAAREAWQFPWFKKRNRAYLRFAVAYGEDKTGEACSAGADFIRNWRDDSRSSVVARLTEGYGCELRLEEER